MLSCDWTIGWCDVSVQNQHCNVGSIPTEPIGIYSAEPALICSNINDVVLLVVTSAVVKHDWHGEVSVHVL